MCSASTSPMTISREPPTCKVTWRRRRFPEAASGERPAFAADSQILKIAIAINKEPVFSHLALSR